MAPSKEETDRYVIHQVEHFRQRYNWDCGVSCVLMLLSKEQQANFLENFTQICTEEGFGQSTWTIDLCYLMKRFNIKHHMFTTMLGVNEDFRKHAYYKKIIDMDRERVQQKFQLASSHGIRVSEGLVSTERLVQHLAREGPALVLVDAGLLVCDLCKHNKLKAEFRRCFGGAYRGHYVLVVGYSVRSRKLLYRDPALPGRLCALAPAALRRARPAATDGDCVLLGPAAS